MYNLLVCSIGNPAPYGNTLHSAGHIVLRSLHEYLNAATPYRYPVLTRSKVHGDGLISSAPEFTIDGLPHTLWQSTSLMNVSGANLMRAWKAFERQLQNERGSGLPRLVVLHDELEAELGQVRCRKGNEGSLKGHRGLLSIRERILGAGMKNLVWYRIGIGIGRPKERDKESVSRWVLKNCSSTERGRIEGAIQQVAAHCRELSAS